MLLAAVGSIFGLAVIAPAIVRLLGARRAGVVMALLPAALAAWFFSTLPAVVAGEALVQSVPFVPGLELNLAMRLDGLALLFALLVTGVGALVVLYAAGYMAHYVEAGRFFFALILFMGSMLGVVLADNLVLLFVFWELTSVSSYLLIGFYHKRESARRAALQALLVTGLGGMALLAGLILIGVASGQWTLSGVISGEADLRTGPLYGPILVLVLLGAFTKSAQFPFHFWLPNAMEAPSPVSAYLHSSTMVKAGVYLLARLNPALGGTDWWRDSLMLFGGVTMVLTAFMAVRQVQYKRLLAYTTASALGTLVFMIGQGSQEAAVACGAFLLTHAMYKGALFLVAGAVDHETGERDTEVLSGLRRAMPIVAGAGAIAALSMAGVPLLFGFVGKELVLESAWHADAYRTAAVVGVVLMALLNVTVAVATGFKPFWGAAKETPRRPHDPPWTMLAGPVLLALLGLATGVAPWLVDGLIGAVASSVRGEAVETHLKIWHGLTAPLALSALAVALGVGLFVARGAFRRAAQSLAPIERIGPERLFDGLLAGVTAGARLIMRAVQSGYLRVYVLFIMLTTVVIVGVPLVTRDKVPSFAWLSIADVRPHEAVLVLLIIGGTIVTLLARGRLAAVAALGVVGYSITAIFVLYGAPDLALTQFSVETLTVIMLVLVLYRLPRFATFSSKAVRARDAALAAMVGGLMGVLALLAEVSKGSKPLSEYFAANAVELGKGRNIVNVIIVDFRAIDTMGEITVLGVAALGVYTLLRLRLRTPEGGPRR